MIFNKQHLIKHLYVATIVSIVAMVFVSCEQSDNTAFKQLDDLIKQHEQLIEKKKDRIEDIKAQLRSDTLSLDNEYTINAQLYNEYAEFQNDSALHYADRNLAIATEMGDNCKFIDSKLNLMHILTKAYMLDETAQMASELDTTLMNRTQLIYYYKVLSDIYLFKAEFHSGSKYEQDYQSMLTNYRKKIASLSDPESDLTLLYKAYYLNDTHHTAEAISQLENLMEKHRSGERFYSVVSSSLAYMYANLGNKEKEKQLLANSAMSDIEGCIMENSALRQLASVLFDEGDIDRAYNYINLSVADATFYGTRLRNVQASQLVPRIISAYQTKQEKNYKNLRNMIIALSVLAAFLVAGLIVIGILLRRYRRSNESRRIINDQLNITVNQLKERDKIKEQYLGRFLALSSQLIDRSEQRRKALNRHAKEKKIAELATQLKSQNFYYENTALFYTNFDSAFLNIYPDFIEEINALLKDGEVIRHERKHELTTELRIMALIRLGITENKEIASILRSSITTIYTYRSKLKARAIDKDNFENNVKNIQSSD